jgi:putative N6-adenine-specific DNA methylase
MYRSIGNFLKKKCRGYRGYVFTAEPALAGQIGLKAKRHYNFFSGKIECRLYEYDLF